MCHCPPPHSPQKADCVFFRDSAALHRNAWAECCFRGVVSMFVAVGEKKKLRCRGNNRAPRSRRKFEQSLIIVWFWQNTGISFELGC